MSVRGSTRSEDSQDSEDVAQAWIEKIAPLRAVDELGGAAIPTAVRRLPWLERLVGVPVWGKFECQQHTGSFKYRGAYVSMVRSGSPAVVAASAGNHGLAVAEVARRLGRTANICVPVVASRLKRERILATGAGLIEHGHTLEEATRHARELATSHDVHYISPYNDPAVIAGSATIALEFLAEVPSLTTMIAPVGGGGLISGLAVGARAAGAEVEIFGCEPERYASVGSSLREGRIVRVLHQPTLADGLAVNLEPESVTYTLVRRFVSGMLTLSEEELAAATQALLVHESVLVEPSGAAGVIACLRLAQQGRLTGPVGIPLCGGNLAHGTLSRIQRFVYQDPDLIRLLDLRGRTVADSPVRVTHPMAERSRPPAEVAADASGRAATAPPSQVSDLVTQLRTCRRRLVEALAEIDEYAAYCHTHHLLYDKKLLERLSAVAEDALERVDLHCSTPESDENRWDWLAEGEMVLRFGLATRSYVRGALEWCSPSYEQSRVTQFFNTGAQDSPTLNYERYESVSVQRVEDQLLGVLDLPPDEFGLTVTSSGMAAYTLVESFLLRERLTPGDTVLLAPYIYFEAAEQLTALPFLRCARTSDYDVDSILADVAAYRPRVLFVDPVANTAQQRMTDVVTLLDRLRREVAQPLTVVIDGTMVSGALPGPALRGGGQVEVIYYESCSKYLQLGLDASMAGLVAYPVGLRPRMERQRRNTGTILYRHQADLFPQFDRDFFQRRMTRICGNARAIAERLHADPGVREAGTVFHPTLPDHPDSAIAARMPYAGGCVTFLFHEPGRNHRDELEPLIDRMLAAARQRGVHLTKGVSFGFSAPRVSAAASMAESEPPFLRLYAGDRPTEHVAALAEAVSEAIRIR